MLPLRSFQNEMRKMAAESAEGKLRPSSKDFEVADRAQLGMLGGSVGGYVASLALLKSPSSPGTAGEMVRHIEQMAKEMKVPEVINAVTPKGSDKGGWSPSYHPDSKAVNIPLHTRDAAIAHELGHAKSHLALDPAIRRVSEALQTISRIGSRVTAAPLTFLAATDKDMSYKPGVLQAIISSPMVIDEAVASAHATAHLISQHGAGKGIWKSLPLVPAFATYLALAGTPMLVTYMRRRAAEQELHSK
jgi:hypothetical protein